MSSLDMPAGVDISETQQPLIIALNIVGYSISVIVVVLRVVARKISRAPLWWDDWSIIFSVVVATVFFFLNVVWMIPRGMGRHIWRTLDISQAIFDFNIGLFFLEICYTAVIISVKYSLLAFYWRIFQVRSIKLPIIILGSIVTSWGLAVWIVTICQCIPVQGFWDKSIESTCSINVTSFFFGNSIPNIITDFAIMVLPVPWIWRLQLRRAQKIALVGIFALGTLVVVISATRLAYILHLDLVNIDITWNFNQTEIWTTLEVFIAIICACLPSLKPIVALLSRKLFLGGEWSKEATDEAARTSNLNTNRSYAWATIKNGITPDKKPPGDDETRPFKPLPGHDDLNAQAKVRANISEGIAGSESDLELENLGGVQVTRNVDIEWHDASK